MNRLHKVCTNAGTPRPHGPLAWAHGPPAQRGLPRGPGPPTFTIKRSDCPKIGQTGRAERAKDQGANGKTLGGEPLGATFAQTACDCVRHWVSFYRQTLCHQRRKESSVSQALYSRRANAAAEYYLLVLATYGPPLNRTWTRALHRMFLCLAKNQELRGFRTRELRVWWPMRRQSIVKPLLHPIMVVTEDQR